MLRSYLAKWTIVLFLAMSLTPAATNAEAPDGIQISPCMPMSYELQKPFKNIKALDFGGHPYYVPDAELYVRTSSPTESQILFYSGYFAEDISCARVITIDKTLFPQASILPIASGNRQWLYRPGLTESEISKYSPWSLGHRKLLNNIVKSPVIKITQLCINASRFPPAAAMNVLGTDGQVLTQTSASCAELALSSSLAFRLFSPESKTEVSVYLIGNQVIALQ